jgi:hypothetical protein
MPEALLLKILWTVAACGTAAAFGWLVYDCGREGDLAPMWPILLLLPAYPVVMLALMFRSVW